MKTMIYYTSNYSPTAMIMAARKTGLIHESRGLFVSDLKHLILLNSGGIKGRLIFIGVDRDYKQIYALTGCGPKEIILRFLKSFLGIGSKENSNYTIIDCSGQVNLLLSLVWFFYQKNIFKFLSGHIICSLINKGFPGLRTQSENL